MLQQMVHKLGINRHVIFQNSFVALRELGEFLDIADLYISPYPEEAQITSGTLAYAMGTGKAIISTRYWYFGPVPPDENTSKNKKIVVYPGKRLSLQRHQHRDEH